VIVAVFRRRLKPGKTVADFTRAWEAELGSEHDFTAEPREIDPTSPSSALAALREG
jgi:hypothetical protein